MAFKNVAQRTSGHADRGHWMRTIVVFTVMVGTLTAASLACTRLTRSPGQSAAIANAYATQTAFAYSFYRPSETRAPESTALAGEDGQPTAAWTATAGDLFVLPPTAGEATATAREAVIFMMDLQDQWDLHLFSSFSNNDDNWPTNSGEDSTAVFSQRVNGRYSWSITGKRSAILSVIRNADGYNDYLITVQAHSFYFGADLSMGIIVRRGDSENYYLFLVTPATHEFTFRAKIDGLWEDIVPVTNNSAIIWGGYNKLAILALGSDFWLFVNDHFLAAAQDSRYASGEIGLAAAIPAAEQLIVSFDDFTMYVP